MQRRWQAAGAKGGQQQQQKQQEGPAGAHHDPPCRPAACTSCHRAPLPPRTHTFPSPRALLPDFTCPLPPVSLVGAQAYNAARILPLLRRPNHLLVGGGWCGWGLVWVAVSDHQFDSAPAAQCGFGPGVGGRAPISPSPALVC